MLFNSYIFIFIFLPLTLLGWFGLNALKWRGLARLFLFGMSLWFYGYFNPSYLPIILVSILVNFAFYKLSGHMAQGRRKKYAMAAAVVFNLAVLFYFKYYDFFISNLNALFATDWALKNIMLPLGISFFTFQQISFVVDAFRGEVPDYDFLGYACFVTFFPQLVAGPIVTHDELVPQLMSEDNKRRADRRENQIRSARDVVAEITEQKKPANAAPPPKKKRRRGLWEYIRLFADSFMRLRSRVRKVPYWVRIGAAAILFTIFALLFSSTNPVVNNTTITVVGGDTAIDNYRILVISDLNGRRFGDRQSKLLSQINQLSYNIVFCLGDMVGEDGDPEPFYELLEGLPASRQVYFIAGDSDPGPLRDTPNMVEGMLEEYVLEEWILGAIDRGAIYLDSPESLMVPAQ